MKVLLFTIAAKEPATQALDTICAWMKAQGIGYSVYNDCVHASACDPQFEQLRAKIAEYDLVCSFGGDGTTLRAAHLIGSSELPLLNFNFGRLGFLSGASAVDLMPAIQAAVDGRLDVDARTMLEARVSYRDGSQKRQVGLNELAVSRGHFGRIVALDIYVNGGFLDSIRGDGVMIATATGSTAYSLSAGGPIIAPSHDGLCIVPIAPHSLASRAVVTTAADSVRIVPNEQNRQQLVLFIDGERFRMHPQGDNGDNGDDLEDSASEKLDNYASIGLVASVDVRACSAKLKLLRYGDYDFYSHISTTFFGSDYAR